MFGRVTKYYPDRGYGFILGEDHNTYFIHRSKLFGEHIESGYYVYFKTFTNDKSDFNAKCVNAIDAPERSKKYNRKHKRTNNGKN